MNLADVYPQYSHPAGFGDKGTAHNYLPTYQREITRTTGVTLLEVGVMHGHSIAMWAAWLTDSNVYGIDNDLTQLTYPHPGIRHGDSTRAEDVDRALPGLTFDYIIDDGDHNPWAQLATLDVLLPRVNPGGRYFIEDIEGDTALAIVTARLDALGLDYHVYDGRGPGRQADELLVTVRL